MKVRPKTSVVIPIALWLLIFVYVQFIEPYLSISKCSWAHDANAGHILVIADPQLIDEHTYKNRNSFLLKISKHFVDDYIHRNYRALMHQLRPDLVVFVGDLLDNGRGSDAEYYNSQVSRFNRIFNNLPQSYALPGNHDIGWGDGVSESSVDKWNSWWGMRNRIVEWNGWEIVLLDDISLAQGDSIGGSSIGGVGEESRNFVKDLGNDVKHKPRVLFTHVTLWRDVKTQTCGPERESHKDFPVVRGHQYQTVVDSETSAFILSNIRPDLVFAGDDHDYCQVEHIYFDKEGKEAKAIDVNVKSISMAMGISKPAVQLLTLGPSSTYSYSMCYISKSYLDVAIYILAAFANMTWNICIYSKGRSTNLVRIVKHVDWKRWFETSLLQLFITCLIYIAITYK